MKVIFEIENMDNCDEAIYVIRKIREAYNSNEHERV